jgi:hypothetical protein
MLRESVKKWVEALRSGEFDQGRSALETTQGFCCLGVACKVYEKETGKSAKYHNGRLVGELLSDQYEVLLWLGLRKADGLFYSGTETETLTHLNDNHADFLAIADLIESEPDGLFIKEEDKSNG